MLPLGGLLAGWCAGDNWLRLLAKLMVSSEEVAATVVARQPTVALGGGLSRMNSVGPTGKAAAQLAQHLARSLSVHSVGSGRSTPRVAGAQAAALVGGGAGSRPLSRRNSLGPAQLPAGSAATSPRGGSGGGAAAAAVESGPLPTAAAAGKQRSRFAGLASRPPEPAEQWAALLAAQPFRQPTPGGGASSWPQPPRPAGSGSATPSFATAASEGELTRQTSLAAAASAPAAWPGAAAPGGQGRAVDVGAEAGAPAATAAAAGAATVAPVDAAAWVQQLSRTQAGIGDLQELLDLHRKYIRAVSGERLSS